MAKTRLDVLLAQRGLAQSREKARAAVIEGRVLVDGRRSDKPGAAFDPDVKLEVVSADQGYVSRGGLKLQRALDYFGGDPGGKVCLDCGASTGGFTDLLLKRGAKKVYAVDVGTGQLAESLRADGRVVVMERTNARYLTPDMFPDRPALACVDVSFISLSLILPAVRRVLTGDGEVFCLIKPQFEAGKENVGKKGVVRSAGTHIRVLEDFIQNAGDAGFFTENITWSPIRGPEGNIEFLAHLVSYQCQCRSRAAEVVAEAHGLLRS